MERVVQHAAKYLGAVIGFLVILALYFFFKMNQSLSADQSYIDDIVEENQALISKSAELEEKVNSSSAEITKLQEDLNAKQATLSQLQQDGNGTPAAACDSLPSSDELTAVEKKLRQSQEKQRSCVASLNSRNDEIRSLEQRIYDIQKERVSSESNDVLESLREELAQLKEENQQLLEKIDESDESLAELDDVQARNAQLTAQISELQEQITQLQQGSNSEDLEAKLAQANDENARLQLLVNELQGVTEEPSAASISGELQIVNFEAKPNYCRLTYPDGSRCVTSVEITASFNFRPGGFIAMRAINPNGSTIDRQSIAGRTITKFTIEFDSDERTTPGEYTVDLSTNDVLNPLKVSQTFVIPAAN